MDIRKRITYAQIKIHGIKEPIILNEGLSIAQLLPAIGRALSEAPNRYEGFIIEGSHTPIGDHKTEQQQEYAKLLSGLDLSSMEMETDEEEAERLMRETTSPYHPNSPVYDSIAHEYIMCINPSHKARKSPEELTILRRHMETHYANTEWWDGTHKWMDENPMP